MLKTIKIATYNIKHGGTLGKNCEAIGRLIAQEQVDIVGLQEVDYNISRSNKQDIVATIAKYANYPYYRFYKAITFSDGDYGCGIISKYPINDVSVLPLSHCQEQRILVETTIEIDRQQLPFFVTHLELGSYQDIRRHQFAEIHKQVSKHDCFILTGDFNVYDWNQEGMIFEYQEYLGSYQILNRPGRTYYTYHSDYHVEEIGPIDNIITSHDFKLKRVYMIHNHFSDHNLFVGEFELS